MYKKNIQRLTKTFLTLSLSDVAARVQLAGPSQAESYILNMVNPIKFSPSPKKIGDAFVLRQFRLKYADT